MLKLLVKKQLTEIFRAYLYDAKKNRARSKAATVGYLVFFVIIMVGIIGGMFTALSLAMCRSMAEAGMSWFYFAIMGLMAILLGAFIMKGITPGPMMYVTELPTVYRVFAALMLANLCMLVVGCLGVRFFAKIVSVEKKMLYPIILVISLLGAFSINKNAFDVGVCVAFGIIGWLMNKYEFPLSPILLALILGPMCEKNFVRYMNIQRGNFFAITTSPIAMVFATVAILVIVYSVYNQSKINKRAAANTAQEKA